MLVIDLSDQVKPVWFRHLYEAERYAEERAWRRMRIVDEQRTTQAVAVLLNIAGGRANCASVLRLMHLADTESLATAGAPITGPVLFELSDVAERIKAMDFWAKHIESTGDDIQLVKNPGDGELSDFDVEVLTRSYERHKENP